MSKNNLHLPCTHITNLHHSSTKHQPCSVAGDPWTGQCRAACSLFLFVHGKLGSLRHWQHFWSNFELFHVQSSPCCPPHLFVIYPLSHLKSSPLCLDLILFLCTWWAFMADLVLQWLGSSSFATADVIFPQATRGLSSPSTNYRSLSTKAMSVFMFSWRNMYCDMIL